MSRNLLPRVVMVVLLLVLTAAPLPAANKEHQQMMADIRMLQEQTQLLQAQLAAVTEALRAVTAKLDEQSGTARKAFADQKLLADTMSNDLRVKEDASKGLILNARILWTFAAAYRGTFARRSLAADESATSTTR